MTDNYSIAKLLRRGNRIGVIDGKNAFYTARDNETGFHYTNVKALSLFNLPEGFRATMSNTEYVNSEYPINGFGTSIALDPRRVYDIIVDKGRVLITGSLPFDPDKGLEGESIEDYIDYKTVVNYIRCFGANNTLKPAMVPLIGLMSNRDDHRAFLLRVEVSETLDSKTNIYTVELIVTAQMKRIVIRQKDGYPVYSRIAGIISESDLLTLDSNLPLPDLGSYRSRFTPSAIVFETEPRVSIRADVMELRHHPVDVFAIENMNTYENATQFNLGTIELGGVPSEFNETRVVYRHGNPGKFNILSTVIPEKLTAIFDIDMMSRNNNIFKSYRVIKTDSYIKVIDAETQQPAEDMAVLLEPTGKSLDSGSAQGPLYYLNLEKSTGSDIHVIRSRWVTNVGNLIPKDIVDANPELKFFGETANFIKYQDLISQTGLMEGTPYTTGDSIDTWLHYEYKGKTLFIPKAPVAGLVSYNHLYSLGLVYGLDGNNGIVPVDNYYGDPRTDYQVVNVGGNLYIVRLMRGLAPANGLIIDDMAGGDDLPITHGSEASDLFAAVIKTKSRNNSYKGTMKGFYSYSDLNLTSDAGGTGTHVFWCQEAVRDADDSTVARRRVVRGGLNPYILGFANSSEKTNVSGWRPVLELIESESIAQTGTINASQVIDVPVFESEQRVLNVIIRAKGSTGSWTSSEAVLSVYRKDNTITLKNESTSDYEFKVIVS